MKLEVDRNRAELALAWDRTGEDEQAADRNRALFPSYLHLLVANLKRDVLEDEIRGPQHARSGCVATTAHPIIPQSGRLLCIQFRNTRKRHSSRRGTRHTANYLPGPSGKVPFSNAVSASDGALGFDANDSSLQFTRTL